TPSTEPNVEPSAEKAAATQASAAKADAKTTKSPSAPPQNQEIQAPKDVAAPPAGAKKSASGLAWVVLKEGTGNKSPGATDKVTVHYTGWTKDGKMFDSSE